MCGGVGLVSFEGRVVIYIYQRKKVQSPPPRDWYIFNLKPGTIEISQVDKITSLSLFTDMTNAQACQEQDRGPELVVFISVCHLYQFYFSPLFQFDDPVI